MTRHVTFGKLFARSILVFPIVFSFLICSCGGGGGGNVSQPAAQSSTSSGGANTVIAAPVPPSPKGTLNPAAINFGDVTVGSSFNLAVALTNIGNADLQVTQATLTGSSSLSFSGLTLPLVLSPGQSVPFSVQFSPQATGAATATVSFSSNSSTVIPPLTLNGNGVAAATAQLSVSPAAINFGSVTVGTTTNQQVTLANTGGANLTVSAIGITGAGFGIVTAPALPFNLAPGQSQAVAVQFAPTTAGAASGQVQVTHDAPNSPATVALSGTGIASNLQLNVSPTNIDFGSVNVGSNTAQVVTMTNVGNGSITVTAANVTGAGLSITPALALPVTLAAGQSQSFTVRFAPTAAGPIVGGSVSLVSNASNSPTAVTLAGNGVAQLLQLSLNPTNVNFGDVTVGSTPVQAVAVTNTGNANVTITSATPTGAGFSVVALALPLTLTPGQTAAFFARFAPTATGAVNGSISLASNATASPTVLTLSGNGVPVPVLTLAVNPSSLDFGDVITGNTGVGTITLTNTGNTSITVNSATASGTGFSLSGFTSGTLNPGQSTSFNAQFAPTSAGAATGSISVVSTATNSPTVISLAGNGVALVATLTPSPSSLSFGSIIVGGSQSQLVTLTNTGNANATITAANFTGSGFGFAPPGLTFPQILAPTQSITLAVEFAPTSAGLVNGSVSLLSNATNSPTAITLSGTGVAQTLTLGLIPASINFGDVVATTTASQSVMVTNTGNTSVTITSANVTGGASGFGFAGLAFPFTLNSGQSSVLTAQFTPPSATGSVSGSISLVSNASNSPTSVALTGNGISAPAPGFLAANPSSFDFGSVIVASTNQTFTLTNTGGTDFNVTAIGISGSGFSIVAAPALPFTLSNGGGSQTVTVQFTPVAAGTVSGSITITSGASNGPTTVIPIGGTGVPAVVSPSSIAFGGVIVGSNTSQTVVITNAGNQNLNVTAGNFLGAGAASYSVIPPLPITVTPGQNQSFTVTFAPTSAASQPATLSFASNAWNSPTVVTLSGNGIAQVLTLGVNPSTIGFGNVLVGSSTSPQSVTVTNTGNTSVNIGSASTTGGPGFSFTGPALPLALAPGLSQVFNVSFAPAAGGAVSGNFTLTSNASNSPTSVALTGTGVPVVNQLTANPSSLDFGNVFVGSNNTQSVTVTNTGNVNVTLNTATPSNAAFSIIGFAAQTLTPGQAVTFSARFTPAAAGSVSGNISVASTAANSPTVISLLGNGVTPILQLDVSPSSINFGSVIVGSNTSQTVVMINAGNQNLSVTAANVTGAGYSINPALTFPIALTPGQSQSFTVQFTPASAGSLPGNISIASNDPTPPTVTLAGTGVAPTMLLSANPVSFDFGNVAVGSSATQSITLTNTGNQSVTVTALNVTGAVFSITPAVSLPLTLNAGQSSSFTVGFAPTVAGGVSGNVSAVSNATNSPTNVALAGTGTVPSSNLLINPSLIDFGTAVVGSQINFNVTLTNSGNATLTVTQANLSGSSTFSVVGLTLPLTLSPAQSASVTIRFSAATTGPVAGAVSFVSNAANSPGTLTLAGAGTTGVALLWDASVTPGLAGYNVYRGTQSGGPYTKLTASLVTTLNYFDTTVSPGTTYFYVVTAVDPDGVESVFSNELQVQIP